MAGDACNASPKTAWQLGWNIAFIHKNPQLFQLNTHSSKHCFVSLFETSKTSSFNRYVWICILFCGCRTTGDAPGTIFWGSQFITQHLCERGKECSVWSGLSERALSLGNFSKPDRSHARWKMYLLPQLLWSTLLVHTPETTSNNWYDEICCKWSLHWFE